MGSIYISGIIFCLSIFSLGINAQNFSNEYRIAVFNSKVSLESGLDKEDGKVLGGAIRDYMVKLTINTNIKVLEKEELYQILENEAEEDKLWGIYDDSTAVEKGKMLRANYVLISEIQSSPLFSDGIRIRSRLVNVETRAIEAAEPITYDPKNGFDNEIDQLCRSLLFGITSKIPVQRTEIKLRDNTSYTEYDNSKSYLYERTLRRFQHRFSNLYIAEAIPDLIRSNVMLNRYIDPDTKLIGVYSITDDGSENLTFSEKGFCWRFYTGERPSSISDLNEGCLHWSNFSDIQIQNDIDYFLLKRISLEIKFKKHVFPSHLLLANMLIHLTKDYNRRK